MSELESPETNCTVCIALGKITPATIVAAAADGMMWYECGQHDPEEHGKLLGEGEPRVAQEDLKAWRRRHGLYFPTRGEFLSE